MSRVAHGSPASRRPGAFALGFAAAAAIAVTLVAGTWMFRRWLDTPAPVPDHATVFSATSAMTFAGPNTLGQRFRPLRNGLTAIDLLLTAESLDLPGDVHLDLLEWATRAPLRTSRVAAASLPAGSPWDLRPGQPAERWTTFGFDPLPDSADRDLLFVVSYAAGPDRPGQRAGTLAALPGTYPTPDLLVNGFPQRGNLLFRAAAAGTHRAAVAVAMDNLAHMQPIARGTLTLPLTLSVACLALLVVLARTMVAMPHE